MPDSRGCEEHGFVPWFNCPTCGGRRYEPDPDVEPLNESPRHDHYGPSDNCSIDCPAYPESAALVTYGDEREPTPRGVDRRNVAIIGAPDAGASTLAERMSSQELICLAHHEPEPCATCAAYIAGGL